MSTKIRNFGYGIHSGVTATDRLNGIPLVGVRLLLGLPT
jgi:hypothetical protein